MSGNKNFFSSVSRRDILKGGFAALAAACVPMINCRKAYAMIGGGAWRVKLRHAHTEEAFNGIYRVGDQYLPDAFQNINPFMRDHRTGEVFPMDPHVLDIISLIQARTRANRPLKIVSAYRSPRTNAMLRDHSRGVAKNSFHMYGQAIDIRMDDYSVSRLRDVAKSLRAGGVGYYPKSDFVHVDTGSVRYW